MADTEHLDRLGHLLWEVSSHATLAAEAALSGTELTLASCGILYSVNREPGITAAEIARRAPKTPQAVNQVAARLEKLGYLERKLADGRGVGLHITPAGERALREGEAIEQQSDERLRETIGADMYDRLRVELTDARSALRRARVEPDAKFR